MLVFSCFHFKRKTKYFLSIRKKSLEGIKRKRAEAEEDSEVEDPGNQDDKVAVESDDDVEYYRQAVGAEPEEGEDKTYTVNPKVVLI